MSTPGRDIGSEFEDYLRGWSEGVEDRADLEKRLLCLGRFSTEDIDLIIETAAIWIAERGIMTGEKE